MEGILPISKNILFGCFLTISVAKRKRRRKKKEKKEDVSRDWKNTLFMLKVWTNGSRNESGVQTTNSATKREFEFFEGVSFLLFFVEKSGWKRTARKRVTEV